MYLVHREKESEKERATYDTNSVKLKLSHENTIVKFSAYEDRVITSNSVPNKVTTKVVSVLVGSSTIPISLLVSVNTLETIDATSFETVTVLFPLSV